MTDQHCEDCKHARNERPNIDLKRRDYDCFGAPPQVSHILDPRSGQIIRLAPDQRPVVGAQDSACGAFRPKLGGGTGAIPLIARAASPRMAMAGGGSGLVNETPTEPNNA